MAIITDRKARYGSGEKPRAKKQIDLVMFRYESGVSQESCEIENEWAQAIDKLRYLCYNTACQQRSRFAVQLSGGYSSVWLERWFVAPEAVSSSLIIHPKINSRIIPGFYFGLMSFCYLLL